MNHSQGTIFEKDSRWTAVDTYTFGHLHSSSSSTPSSSVLEHTLKNSEEQGLPKIAVAPSQGKLLQLIARIGGAKRILELGTLGGYSTIWLATAGPEVHVTSIEVDAHHAEVARANIEYAGLSSRIDVHLGRGQDILPALAEEVAAGKRERFDFVFIDADKEHNWFYVDSALGMSRSGATIVVDNVVRKGQIVLDAYQEDPKVVGSRLVVENIGKDERLDGTVLQTVDEKSYDGFLLAVKR